MTKEPNVGSRLFYTFASRSQRMAGVRPSWRWPSRSRQKLSTRDARQEGAAEPTSEIHGSRIFPRKPIVRRGFAVVASQLQAYQLINHHEMQRAGSQTRILWQHRYPTPPCAGRIPMLPQENNPMKGKITPHDSKLVPEAKKTPFDKGNPAARI